MVSVFTAVTIASLLFLGFSLKGKEFRRSYVGKVWSKAAGMGPDVKRALQRNGFPEGNVRSRIARAWKNSTIISTPKG